MSSEAALQRNIQTALRGRGAWPLKMHGGRYMPPGIPDLLILFMGSALFMEVKRPGGKPSPIQTARMEEIASGGFAPCEVVTSVDEALAKFDRWVSLHLSQS